MEKIIVTNQYSDSISIINTEMLVLEKTVASASFPKVLILTVHLLSLSVGLMRKSLPSMRNQSVISYASTGKSKILGILFLQNNLFLN